MAFEHDYNKTVAPYMNIISQAIVKEALHKKTHYAFYHATSNRWTLLADLFTQLYAYFHPEKKVSSDCRGKALRTGGRASTS